MPEDRLLPKRRPKGQSSVNKVHIISRLVVFSFSIEHLLSIFSVNNLIVTLLPPFCCAMWLYYGWFAAIDLRRNVWETSKLLKSALDHVEEIDDEDEARILREPMDALQVHVKKALQRKLTKSELSFYLS